MTSTMDILQERSMLNFERFEFGCLVLYVRPHYCKVFEQLYGEIPIPVKAKTQTDRFRPEVGEYSSFSLQAICRLSLLLSVFSYALSLSLFFSLVHHNCFSQFQSLIVLFFQRPDLVVDVADPTEWMKTFQHLHVKGVSIHPANEGVWHPAESM